jgi:N-acetylmuramoyl-L-alanine amidase
MKTRLTAWSSTLLVLAGFQPAVGTPDGAPVASSGSAPVIAIDPGHGGTNTGAPGVGHGVYDKQLTLELGRELAGALRQRGYRVVLTRDRDEYLTLRQRVRVANEAGADLLVSLHANATATHGQRGYETFILTPRGLDVDARALRRDDGPARADVDRDTALLLDDLERGAAHARAADVAASIQAALRAVRGPDGDRGVKQDAMHVLLGAHMPAVLVEVGFVDHPVEGVELADAALRARLAGALADAVTAAVP